MHCEDKPDSSKEEPSKVEQDHALEYVVSVDHIKTGSASHENQGNQDQDGSTEKVQKPSIETSFIMKRDVENVVE